jgi:hypothetical protein
MVGTKKRDVTCAFLDILKQQLLVYPFTQRTLFLSRDMSSCEVMPPADISLEHICGTLYIW